MAISPIIEVKRTAGLPAVAVAGVVTPDIIAGRAIKLASASTVTAADGTLLAATNSILGLAAETSKNYTAVNGAIVQDDYAKNGMISAFQDGGTFKVWDDGRGAVFAADVVNAAVNTLLYIDSEGKFTTVQGSASSVGYYAVGMILSAPTATTGILVVKMFK